MSRSWFLLAAALALALPVRASDAPAYSDPDAPGAKGPALVDPSTIAQQTEDLRDAVAKPMTPDATLHFGAASLFESVQSKTPVFATSLPRIEREPVTGELGTVEGMHKTAEQRWDHYKMTTKEVPNADLEATLLYAQSLKREKRVDFDQLGTMAENQMGTFLYAKDKLEGGIISLNQRLALIASRIGEALSFATVAHEAAHARARAAGRLDPKKVIDGELEAYRAEYLWLKAIDPKAERLATMQGGLEKWLKKHPTDQVSRMALKYTNHLIEVYNTDGEESRIRDMIKRLGYQDGDHDHDGGVHDGADGLRA